MKFQTKPYAEFLRELYQKPEGEQKNQSWFALHNDEKLESAELYIYDYIGRYGVEPQAVVLALQAVKGKALKVRLNTPGGSAFDGFTIYNLLREHQGGLTVIVDGLAASAGSLIVMAGEKIIMKPGSRMMIHDAWGITIGSADDHLYSAERLDEMSADLAEVYSDRSGTSKRMIRQMMKAETWFGAKQAVEAGFADEVDKKPTENDKAEFVVPQGMYKNPQGMAESNEGAAISDVVIVPKAEGDRFIKGLKLNVDRLENSIGSFNLETEQRRLRLASA